MHALSRKSRDALESVCADALESVCAHALESVRALSRVRPRRASARALSRRVTHTLKSVCVDALQSVCARALKSVRAPVFKKVYRRFRERLHGRSRERLVLLLSLSGLGQAVSNQLSFRNYFLTLWGTGGGQKKWTV